MCGSCSNRANSRVTVTYIIHRNIFESYRPFVDFCNFPDGFGSFVPMSSGQLPSWRFRNKGPTSKNASHWYYSGQRYDLPITRQPTNQRKHAQSDCPENCYFNMIKGLRF